MISDLVVILYGCVIPMVVLLMRMTGDTPVVVVHACGVGDAISYNGVCDVVYAGCIL